MDCTKQREHTADSRDLQEAKGLISKVFYQSPALKHDSSDRESKIIIEPNLTTETESDSSCSSKDSKLVIAPDENSISNLLNFDSDEDSCDDLLEENGARSIKTRLMAAISEENIDRGKAVYEPNKKQMNNTLKQEFKKSWSQLSPSIALTNLSLEEVGHIRSVHAKADIESMPDDCQTKRDVISGKVCFQCVKTRFSLFSKSCKCPLCGQAVCSRCIAKINATPSLLLPVSDSTKISEVKETSPRQRSATCSVTSSSPKSSMFPRTKSFKSVSGTLNSRGSILAVCLDCKDMVLHIIRSGETARKMEAARAMMLASLGEQDVI